MAMHLAVRAVLPKGCQTVQQEVGEVHQVANGGEECNEECDKGATRRATIGSAKKGDTLSMTGGNETDCQGRVYAAMRSSKKKVLI